MPKAYLDLPDIEPNRPLLDAFREQRKPARHGDSYAAGRWELHTHPDLEEQLEKLAGLRAGHVVYGLPCVAVGPSERAVAAAVAVSMHALYLRLPTAPSGLRMQDRTDGPGADDGWYCVDAWQSERQAEDRLARYVRGAVAYARDLAARLGGS